MPSGRIQFQQWITQAEEVTKAQQKIETPASVKTKFENQAQLMAKSSDHIGSSNETTDMKNIQVMIPSIAPTKNPMSPKELPSQAQFFETPGPLPY